MSFLHSCYRFLFFVFGLFFCPILILKGSFYLLLFLYFFFFFLDCFYSYILFYFIMFFFFLCYFFGITGGFLFIGVFCFYNSLEFKWFYIYFSMYMWTLLFTYWCRTVSLIVVVYFNKVCFYNLYLYLWSHFIFIISAYCVYTDLYGDEYHEFYMWDRTIFGWRPTVL